MKTRDQYLLSKLYECQEEIQAYVNDISIEKIKQGDSDLNYKTILTILTAKNSLDKLIGKLETMICDKQDLM